MLTVLLWILIFPVHFILYILYLLNFSNLHSNVTS